MTSLSLVILTSAAAIAPPVLAQRVAPFSSVSLSVGPQWEAQTSDLDQWWVARSVGEAFVTTPFHLGQIELGVAVHRFEPRREGTPRFDALLGYAGWDLGFRPRSNVRIAVGPRAGIYFMDFDVEEGAGLRTESEAALGLHARITVHPLPFVGLYAGGTFMQTYTRVRLRQYHVSSGVVLTMKSPRWLARALR